MDPPAVSLTTLRRNQSVFTSSDPMLWFPHRGFKYRALPNRHFTRKLVWSPPPTIRTFSCHLIKISQEASDTARYEVQNTATNDRRYSGCRRGSEQLIRMLGTICFLSSNFQLQTDADASSDGYGKDIDHDVLEHKHFKNMCPISNVVSPYSGLSCSDVGRLRLHDKKTENRNNNAKDAATYIDREGTDVDRIATYIDIMHTDVDRLADRYIYRVDTDVDCLSATYKDREETVVDRVTIPDRKAGNRSYNASRSSGVHMSSNSNHSRDFLLPSTSQNTNSDVASSRLHGPVQYFPDCDTDFLLYENPGEYIVVNDGTYYGRIIRNPNWNPEPSWKPPWWDSAVTWFSRACVVGVFLTFGYVLFQKIRENGL